ncbi:MAG: LVIVD repeat-containing protein [Actinomycetota bacterium]
MRRMIRWSMLAVSLTALVAAALPAGADHKTYPSTSNIHALGHSVQIGTFSAPDGQRVISSDLAFWGKLAYQGNYNGFRVIDISAPGNPKLLSHPTCNGDQGDIVVWEDILVRAWNTKRAVPRECSGETVAAGFEGVHVFDVSDPTNPTVVDVDGPHLGLELPCGSHTVTAAGIDDGDLIVYSNISSSSGCTGGDPAGDFMDVIAVPLDDPAGAALIHREPLAGPTTPVATGCHDVGVILGDVNKAVCASADTTNVFDIANPRDPALLFTITEPGVGQAGTNGRWHSGAFTWDGEVIVLGWEPGGGGDAECQATDPDVDKSMFFYDADTGAKLGQWVLPRAQGPDENCTIHNYNMVPLRSGRHVAVGGHYQAGTWVVDFTDPANPITVAWADPPSLGPGPFCPATTPPGCHLGGAWSSYWYNGEVYETDITRGLAVYKVSDSAVAGALKLDHLNPQTQEFSL